MYLVNAAPLMLFPELPPPAEPSPRLARKRTMEELQRASYDAVRVLRQGLIDQNLSPTQLRAAEAILNRAGFGPSSSIAIDDQTFDFTHYTKDQLEQRVKRLQVAIRAQRGTESDDVPPLLSGDDEPSGPVH